MASLCVVNAGTFSAHSMAKLQTVKGDWSDHEHSRIDRIRAECAGYEGLEVECSHTDERDPCCIVYDRESDEVIVHIARIDCRYTVMRASCAFRRSRPGIPREGGRLYRLKPARDSDDPGRLAGQALVSTSSSGQLAGSSSSF